VCRQIFRDTTGIFWRHTSVSRSIVWVALPYTFECIYSKLRQNMKFTYLMKKFTHSSTCFSTKFKNIKKCLLNFFYFSIISSVSTLFIKYLRYVEEKNQIIFWHVFTSWRFNIHSNINFAENWSDNSAYFCTEKNYDIAIFNLKINIWKQINLIN
jgi:hypothetical protein